MSHGLRTRRPSFTAWLRIKGEDSTGLADRARAQAVIEKAVLPLANGRWVDRTKPFVAERWKHPRSEMLPVLVDGLRLQLVQTVKPGLRVIGKGNRPATRVDPYGAVDFRFLVSDPFLRVHPCGESFESVAYRQVPGTWLATAWADRCGAHFPCSSSC